MQLVLRSLHHIYESIFSGTFSGTRSFLEVFKQVISIHFPEFFCVYLLSIISQLLISIYSLNIDFWKMSKVLCSRFPNIFLNITFKYNILYTSLQIILKCFYQKVFRKSWFEGRDIFEIVVKNLYRHKNVQ